MADHPVASYFFILANMAVMAGYLFMAFGVAPRLKSLRMLRTKIGAIGFFFLCGMTHGDQALHALFFSDHPYGEIVAQPHMLIIHLPQAVFAWLFVTGLYVELTAWGPWGIQEPAPAPELDMDQLASISSEEDVDKEASRDGL